MGFLVTNADADSKIQVSDGRYNHLMKSTLYEKKTEFNWTLTLHNIYLEFSKNILKSQNVPEGPQKIYWQG